MSEAPPASLDLPRHLPRSLYMDQPVKLDFVWAGLCLLGAVYFIFRS